MKAKTLLLLDTAMPRGLVALSQEGQVCAEIHLHESRRHGEKLAQAIHSVLAKAALNASDLDGIVVGLGPGSFVGIRVALSTAKGFALALQIPLWGISTLASLAASFPSDLNKKAVALIDARRGQGYIQSFNWESHGLTACSEAQACDPSELDQILQGSEAVIGNGLFLLNPSSVERFELSGVTGNGVLLAFQARCFRLLHCLDHPRYRGSSLHHLHHRCPLGRALHCDFPSHRRLRAWSPGVVVLLSRSTLRSGGQSFL